MPWLWPVSDALTPTLLKPLLLIRRRVEGKQTIAVLLARLIFVSSITQ